MPTTVTVLYKQGTKFDMKYYQETHMQIVDKAWRPYGLQSWKVVQLPDDAPYTVMALLEFPNSEDFPKAQSSDSAKEVMDDIPKFADPPTPVFLVGDVVHTS